MQSVWNLWRRRPRSTEGPVNRLAGSFIGSHVATLLLACGYDVIVVGNYSSGERENVPQGARFYELDFGSGCAEVFEEYNPMSCATRRP